MLHFIDDASLLLLVDAAALLLLVRYGVTISLKPALVDQSLETHRAEGYPFLFIGLLMTILGARIALFWPLGATVPPSGNPNIVIGWPALFFGVLFLVASLLMLRGNGFARDMLRPLCWPAACGGAMNCVLALALLQTGLGQPRPVDPMIIRVFFGSYSWAGVYIFTGLGALLSPLAIRAPGIWRLAMSVIILLSGAFLLLASLLVIMVHVQLFNAYP